MKLRPETDLNEIAAQLPPNFTGADFSALTSEAYMIAVKERITAVQQEIAQFKVDQQMDITDELLPETYFKLKHPDDLEAQKNEIQVAVGIEHLQASLHQVIPSISMQELLKYEKLRDKYSASAAAEAK